jgi:hypothetical protein
MPLDQTDNSFCREAQGATSEVEIYRAGRMSPIKESSMYFETMATASRAGKEALKQLLDKLHSEYLRWPLV